MADVYKVGVEIFMTGNIMEALTRVSSHMIGIQGQITKVNKAFGGWGPTLAAVAGVAGLGLVAKGMEGILEKTRVLSDEWGKLKQMGADINEIQRVRQAAIDITRTIPGTTEAGVTGMYNSIRNIFARHPDEAFGVLPGLATFAQVLRNNNPNMSAEEANKTAYSTIRAADLTGQMTNAAGDVDVEKLKQFMDVVSKIALATHSNVGPQEWLNIAKQGGIALSGSSEAGLISAGIIAQAMGGNRFGTAEMSLFQQMAGGKMTANTAQELENLGLLNKGEWRNNKGGGIIMDTDASKRLMGMIQEDPLAFMQDMQKRMVEHGITDQQDQIREIFRIFGRATTQREMGDILRNMNQMLAEREAIKKAMDSGQALQAQNVTSITAAMNNVSAAFTNLQTAIGGPNSEKIVTVIQAMAGAIRGVSELVRLITASGLEKALGPMTTIFSGGASNGVFALINALGWIGMQGAAMDHAASAIRGVGTEINALIGIIGGGLRNLIPGGGGSSATPPDINGFGGPGLKGGGIGPEPEKHSMNFILPHREPKPITLTANMTVDGQTLARIVEERIAEMHEMPDAASAANGVAYNNLNDWSPTSRSA